MKLNGMAGKGSGKLGSHVYATVRGVQIVRQYNDVVFNPNTQKQVLQRARFSALTKLAAMVSNSLVFQNKGAMVSNRNAFIKANSGKFSANTATVMFGSLSLSSGSAAADAYPTVMVNQQTHVMTISLQSVYALLAGFAYAVIMTVDDGYDTIFARSGIVNSTGVGPVSTTVQLPSDDTISDVYVIGYPMFYKDGATKVTYQANLRADDVTDDIALSQVYNSMAGKGDIIVYATRMFEKTT